MSRTTSPQQGMENLRSSSETRLEDSLRCRTEGTASRPRSVIRRRVTRIDFQNGENRPLKFSRKVFSCMNGARAFPGLSSQPLQVIGWKLGHHALPQARHLGCHVLYMADEICRARNQRREEAPPAGRREPAVETEGRGASARHPSAESHHRKKLVGPKAKRAVAQWSKERVFRTQGEAECTTTCHGFISIARTLLERIATSD